MTRNLKYYLPEEFLKIMTNPSLQNILSPYTPEFYENKIAIKSKSIGILPFLNFYIISYKEGKASFDKAV